MRPSYRDFCLTRGLPRVSVCRNADGELVMWQQDVDYAHMNHKAPFMWFFGVTAPDGARNLKRISRSSC